MYLIVGLGNPENEGYTNTRHNSGFNSINKISEKYDIPFNKARFKGLIGDGKINGERVLLLKPQTYMNLSGDSIIEVINFYKIELDHVIVIYDDIDIEPGKIKIRKKGSAGTHNGMKSVINRLGTEEFPRIRVGIGAPDGIDLINHVINKVSKEELEVLDEGWTLASKAAVEIITEGIDSVMNKYN